MEKSFIPHLNKEYCIVVVDLESDTSPEIRFGVQNLGGEGKEVGGGSRHRGSEAKRYGGRRSGADPAGPSHSWYLAAIWRTPRRAATMVKNPHGCPWMAAWSRAARVQLYGGTAATSGRKENKHPS